MRLLTEQQMSDLSAKLGRSTGPRVASIATDNDPFDFARTGAALVDRAVAFSAPDGVRLAGLGTAWRASASGQGRFNILKSAVTERGLGDVKAFVGFSFLDEPHESDVWAGYAAAEVFVPRIGIEGTESGATVTVVIPEGEDAEPTLELLGSMRHPGWAATVDTGDHSTESRPAVGVWADQVRRALSAIAGGEVDKVVLARSVVVRSSQPPPILRMFRSLVRSYPECYNFAWKSGDAVFMGASPELLASVRKGVFRANPLAGSAPRGEGSAEDDAIGERLMSSPKDRREHDLVVADMAVNLAPLVSPIVVPDAPSLKKMASVQHLSTVIEGSVADGVGLFDVLDAVHPTPAVGGVPTEAAIALIEDIEEIDRGWYTGGLGWVDSSGDGAIAIGLRCGLIRGTTTHLFAGAGIVEGSEPTAELDETRLKLVPLMNLLTAS